MPAAKKTRQPAGSTDLGRPVSAQRSVAIANHHPRLRINPRAVTRVIHALDAHAGLFSDTTAGGIRRSATRRTLGVPAGELSIVFLTDAALARLHADFLADPSATDVITFEGEAAPGLPAEAGPAGEICVSADAAARQVGLALPAAGRRAAGRRRPGPRPAFSEELTLYVIHGWLHLAGFDDLVPTRKRAMRRAEARAMKLLREQACLPAFVFG